MSKFVLFVTIILLPSTLVLAQAAPAPSAGASSDPAAQAQSSAADATEVAQATPPGSAPPIGPIDVPGDAQNAQPSAAEPAPPAAPAEGAPATEGAPPEEPLDVKFELQSIRDDAQGLQTDLENFKFQWQRERDLHTAITTRALLINGVIQSRFAWVDQDTTNASTYARRSTFDIGSAIIGFSGNLYKDYEEGRNLTYSLRYGASPQTATNNSFLNLLDANITYSVLPTVDRETPALTITVGQQLLPFGLEVPATEELKPVIRNAEFTTALQLARRDIGLIVKGDLFAQMDYGYSYRQALLSYAIGLINGAGPNAPDDNDFKDFIGRLAFTVPSEYNSWLRQITIGGTVYYGKKNTLLADNKTIAGKGVRQRYGVDVYYNHWPFGVTYEFIVGKDVATPGTTLVEPLRADITSRSHVATFFLSFGEQFVSGFRNQGRYDDWWPKTWQPFVRFDSFNRNTNKADTKVDTLTVGLNVFFAETTKLQINYNHRNDDLNPQGPSNEVSAQLQFGF
jgi:hypothetical protein